MTGLHALAGPKFDTPARRYGNAVSASANRAACWIRMSDCDGEMWRVVTTHLALASRERRGQVEQVLQSLEAPAMPGALNAWSIDGRTLRRLLSHFYRACAPRTFPTRCPLFAFNLITMHPGERLAGVNVHRSSHGAGGIGSLFIDREAIHVAIKLTLVTKTL